MRPLVVAWLARHHLPLWLAPSMGALLGVASLVGVVVILKLARRDGERVEVQARALLCGYLAAIVGAFAFDSVLALPAAIASRDVTRLLAGGASSGALLAGGGVAILVLRWHGASVTAFLDRAAACAGFAFALVRLGCLLNGCDHGRITGGPLGISFPPGSPAAVAHAARGLVPVGAASLPVYSTQIFEMLLAVAASAIVLPRVLRGERSGRPAISCALVYACGRFVIELFKEQTTRACGLSPAQWVSIAIVAGCVLSGVRPRSAPSTAAGVAGVGR